MSGDPFVVRNEVKKIRLPEIWNNLRLVIVAQNITYTPNGRTFSSRTPKGILPPIVADPSHSSISFQKISPKANHRLKESNRGSWGSRLQFILTCLGCAIGLGNIWRFPSRAYQNGGSAFLIPYLTCGFLFGIPVIYGEYIMGQYSHVSAVKTFKFYAPAFQGLGWAMVAQEIFFSTYYTVIIAYTTVFFGYVLYGDTDVWNRCNNKWNTELCVSGHNYDDCRENNKSTPYYDPLRKVCIATVFNDSTSSTMEFFEKSMTARSAGIDDINGMHTGIMIALLVVWAFMCLALIKGDMILGYMSYVTVALPYAILMILLLHGLTLPGANTGVIHFLQPKLEKIWEPRIWSEAMMQLLFSLTAGTGAHITMASFNNRESKIYTVALAVVLGDTLMSVLGGVAVFSVLGYLSHQTGKEISELAESGPSLAFIIYPEAMNMTSSRWFWMLLFFLMLILLGVSTETVAIKMLATCMYDEFDFCRRHKWVPIIGTCSIFFALGLIFCTDAGWFWFLLADEYVGSVSRTAIIALEFIVFAWIYGFRKIHRDMENMWGEAPPFWSLRRWIGAFSPFFLGAWTLVCPLTAIVITVLLCCREWPMQISVDHKTKYLYPSWAMCLGWFSTVSPLLSIPGFFFYNWYRFKKNGKVESLFPKKPTFSHLHNCLSQHQN